jgi:hypothetical protein
MSTTARVLDFQHIGTAWRFVLDCEDDEPRGYGVDQLPAYPTRRDGVFRQRSHADATETWLDERARGFEDALIARLDGEAGEDEEEVEAEAVAWAEVEEDDTAEDEASPLLEAESTEGDDPTDVLAKCEGLGHRARREVPVLLRFAV